MHVASYSLNHYFAQTQFSKYKFNGNVYSIVRDSSGNTYVGGAFQNVSINCGKGVSLNSSTGDYNENNATFNALVRCVVAIPGGGWYVGGDFTSIGGQTRNRLARINADGTLHAFDPDINGSVCTLLLDGSGNLYVGGTFSLVNGNVTRNRIAKFNSDGTLNTFNPSVSGGTSGYVGSFALDASNNLFIGGVFTTVSANTRNNLAKLASDGTVLSFNPNMNGSVSSLVLDASGNLFAGGGFTTANGTTRNRLAKYDASGVLTSFNPNMNNTVAKLLLDASENLYVGGQFTTVGGVTRNRLAQYNSSGTLTSFNPNMNNIVYTLALDASACLYVGGAFTKTGTIGRNRIAKFNSDGSLNSFNPIMDNTVYALALNQSEDCIFTGGNFSYCNSRTKTGLAKFDVDGKLSPFNAYLSGNSRIVYSLSIDANQNLFVGGSFSLAGYPAVSRSNLAKFAPDGSVDSYNPIFNGVVRTITHYSNGNFYVGGSFTQVNGGTVRNRLVKFNPDGSLHAFNPNLSNTVYTVYLDSVENIYLGGDFTTVEGGTARNYFAKFNADGTLNAFDPNFTNAVKDIEMDITGNLFVGGNFIHVGTENRVGIAKFNSNGTLNSWDPGLNGTVNVILPTDDGSLYLGGTFFELSHNWPRDKIAKFNPDGSLNPYNPLFPGGNIYTGGAVYDLLLDETAKLHVGGYFSLFYKVYQSCVVPTASLLNTSATVCGSGILTLSAGTNAGEITWYDQATNGTLLSTGEDFTTPNISTTTTFYAQATDGECVSASRLAITVSPGSCTELKPDYCGITLTNFNDYMACYPVSGATAYKFKVFDGTNTYYYTSPSVGFRFTLIPEIQYNTTYYISVASQVGGVWSEYGVACEVKTPLTTLKSWYCDLGAIIDPYQYLMCYPVKDAINYKFKLFDGTNTLTYLSLNGNAFRFYYVPGIQPNTTYQVSVASYDGQSWSDYGPTCSLLMQTPVSTTIRALDCNITLSSMTQNIFPIVPSGFDRIYGYKYKLFDGTNTLIYNGSSSFKMSNVPGIQLNTTYAVSVAYNVGVWSDFGTACNITSAATFGAFNDHDEPIEVLDGQLMDDVSIEAYPNPNDGNFVISSTHEGGFILTNELGQILQTIHIALETGLKTEVKELENGVYFITGTVQGKTITQRIVVI